MINDKEVQEFIKILENTVEYVKETDTHWLGTWKLTNEDMKKMCSTKFGYWYNKLNNTQRTKVRQQIFRALRGENNG